MSASLTTTSRRRRSPRGRQVARKARAALRATRQFGRGGEEIEAIVAAGIPVQVVPGITAATGCAAYAGIPLTHRDHAQACVFVTGHAKTGKLSLDWNALIQPRQTVAIFMGLGHLAELMEEFVAHGADPKMPASIDTAPGRTSATGHRTLANKRRREGNRRHHRGAVVTLRENVKATAMAPVMANRHSNIKPP
jgi:uroporphyrin-III C-methyltransferase/precorrin-2 dehydrogenase/sirohydrochlorin ferrochelatase